MDHKFEIRYRDDGSPYVYEGWVNYGRPIPNYEQWRADHERLRQQALEQCRAEEREWAKRHPWYTRLKWYEWILLPLMILFAPFIFVYY